MTADRYVKQIVKKIKCSGQKRKEIRRQLLADIELELQRGETMAAIVIRMGEPIAIAEEFNQNLSDRERKLYKRNLICKAIACMAAVIAVLALAAAWFLPKTSAIESSGIYKESEVKERSREVIKLLDQDDYETLRELSSDEMNKVFDKKEIDRARKYIGDDWGEFREFGNCYMQEYKQMGKTMAIVQMNAAYEHTGVTYTLLFNEEMELEGLYMK